MKTLFHTVETVKSKVKQLPISPCQYLICTDSGDIYYDTMDGVRKHMTDIIDLETESERASFLAPLDKVYFVKETGYFWRYSDQEWINLSKMAAGGSKTVYSTLVADAWEDGQQTIFADELKADQNGFIGLPVDISGVQMEAARDAELYLCDQKDGQLTIAFYSVTPQVDIPVVLVLLS